jgi:hypothetical protein
MFFHRSACPDERKYSRTRRVRGSIPPRFGRTQREKVDDKQLARSARRKMFTCDPLQTLKQATCAAASLRKRPDSSMPPAPRPRCGTRHSRIATLTKVAGVSVPWRCSQACLQTSASETMLTPSRPSTCKLLTAAHCFNQPVLQHHRRRRRPHS